MDENVVAGLARGLAARRSRRAGLGLVASAILPLLRPTGASDAKQKREKKTTLCVNGQTVRKPARQAKKLQRRGAGKGACRCGNGGPCVAFYTESRFTGSEIGGLAGADATCTTLANAAGLAGSFRAWLSAGNQTPATRFDAINRAGPWVLPEIAADAGSPPLVATDFQDLVTCGATCLQSAIDRDQFGVPAIGNTVAWTGTEADGAAAAANCANWTSDTGDGQVGVISQVTAPWTSFTTFGCNVGLSLYCFQQAT